MRGRAYKHTGAGTDTRWIGGSTYALQKQQFQLLHKRFGLRLAIDWAEDLITWKDQRRPARENFLAWALEVDQENAEIPESVARTFTARMDNAMKAAALEAVRASAKASQAYSHALKSFMDNMQAGDIDEKKLEVLNKLSSSFMHANNGTGFMYREVAADKQQQIGQQINFGNVRVISSRTQPNKKRLPKNVIEGEVKLLEAG